MARQPVHKTSIEFSEKVMDLLNFAAEKTGRSKKSIVEDGIIMMGCLLTPEYMDTHPGISPKDPCSPTIKPYCSQNKGDCLTCSLVCYDRDCRNNPI